MRTTATGYLTTMTMALLMTLVLGASVGAQPNPDSWVIGVHDGVVTPAFLGALEYLSVDQATFFAGGTPDPATQLANGWRYVTFDYNVTGPTDDSPTMPGYIGPENVCIFNTSNDRPCTVSTTVLNINFTLSCAYESGELDFVLSRYGSEEGDVLLDGISLGPPADANEEGGHVGLTYDLPAAVPGGVLAAGPHTITLGYIGGGAANGNYIDELSLIAGDGICAQHEGRMTGGGSVLQDGGRVTHGFELHCDPSIGPNNLEVNWRGRGWRGSDGFHLETLETAECLDTILDETPPTAGFDTYIGSGTGRYNGMSGYTANWVFTDAGQPGRDDTATIVITDPDGNVVLDVSGNLQQGNQQAH